MAQKRYPEWIDRISPRLNLAGEERHRRGSWFEGRRVIYDHELMLFGGDGRYRIEFDHEAFSFSAGSYLIIPPRRWHVCRGTAQGEIHRAWIHFDWEPIPPIPDSPILTYAPGKPRARAFRMAPSYLPAADFGGEIADPKGAFLRHGQIQRLVEHGTECNRLKARGLFLGLLAELLPLKQRALPRYDSKAEEIRLELQRLAEEPFSRAPMIRVVLERGGLSADHQARLFKQAFGVTPGQYVASLRSDRMKTLLLDRSLTIAEAGALGGFQDPVYFSRFFKKAVGMTPTEYRRSLG